MYHYKAPHDGCTRHSVNGLKYIDKLGKLLSIEAYTVASMTRTYETKQLVYFVNTWYNPMIRIIVRGVNGGFLWGYGGEGPHGLRDLFIKCGFNKELADHYAFTGTLGTNDATIKNTKRYHATSLWKFLNSEIGWNNIII